MAAPPSPGRQIYEASQELDIRLDYSTFSDATTPALVLAAPLGEGWPSLSAVSKFDTFLQNHARHCSKNRRYAAKYAFVRIHTGGGDGGAGVANLSRTGTAHSVAVARDA